MRGPRLFVVALLVAAGCRTHDYEVLELRQPPSAAELGPSGERPAAELLPATWWRDLPMIEATIDGRGPYRFLLDSGASFLFLADRVADELRLPREPLGPDGDGFRFLTGGGGSAQAREAVRFGALRVGSVDFGPGGAIRWDLSLVNQAGVHIDGIFPARAFNSSLLVIDYPRRTVSVESGALASGGPGVLPMTGNPYVPFVVVPIGGVPCEVEIDTGSGGFLDLPAEREGALKFRSPVVPVGMSATAAGVVPRREGRLAEPIEWAGARLEDPVVGLTASSFAVAGSELFREFRVTFDFANRRIRFERSDPSPVRTRPVTGTGAGYLKTGDAWTIAYVLDGSPAARAGLRTGDRVETVDGRPAASIDLGEAVRPKKPGDVVRLRVTGDAGTRDVDLEVVTFVE